MRIAVAGFQHETNTFAPSKAGFEEFRMAGSWPALLQGDAVIEQTRGMNLPIAGAIAAAKGVDLLPILWCAAEPSGPVTDAAFDRIAGMILDGLRGAEPLDGVFLDLHGAMATESREDGEGALLRLIRREFGDLPIGVSLDLHANISPAMVEAATVIAVYRTYPHLDMAETGARCMRRLLDAIGGRRLYPAFRQIPFLVPTHAQHTGAQPCRRLYDRLFELDGDAAHADIAMGFTAADVHDCGPSILAYAATARRADDTAAALAAEFIAARDEFDTGLHGPEDAVAIAIQSRKRGGKRPVVLADVQDNPGGGGTSDTTGLLRALLRQRARDAILGVLCDAEVAARAHRVGVGNAFHAALGAKSGLPGDKPLTGRFAVHAIGDGRIPYTGRMYGGGVATLGPSCVVAPLPPDSDGDSDSGADIRIVVGSVRIQCLDRALFTHFGLDPARAGIVCVKSTVHHRADFEPIAARILNVAAPGAFSCRPALGDYRRLRAGVDCLQTRPAPARP